ncbi:MAG: SDR family oxidoreductase [Propionibacteriaceae bacterium]|nr:SDR family oxidoreductase [Propionibacteriaceae bacterium]
MRILVLGANGMLGSEAIRVLSSDNEVFAAARSKASMDSLGIDAQRLGLAPDRLLFGLDAMEPASVGLLLDDLHPDVVLNAVGVVKQRPAARDAVESIAVNSLWPHVLAGFCDTRGARLIHVSTDCVFSGRKGNYREDDFADADDLYGRSKQLGEVVYLENTVTIRTSIVGWQFGTQNGLFGWFASHRSEPLVGYSRAIFSGLTTRALCKVIRDVILPDESLSGLYHVSAAPIDKFSLLSKLSSAMDWDVSLGEDPTYEVDKSLDSSAFQARTRWKPPAWDGMLAHLVSDYDYYYG